MHAPRISLIAAIGRNRELGKQNRLIWHISPDLRRVKALTMGHPIIMGRNTYASIGRPLPGRTNIVISRTAGPLEGCEVYDSLEKGLARARALDPEEIFLFGGARIYDEGLPHATRLYLTLVDREDPEADVFFPDFRDFTRVLAEEPHPEHTPPFTWLTLERA